MHEADRKASQIIQEQQGELSRKILGFIKDNYSSEEQTRLQRDFWGVSIMDVMNNIGLNYLRRLYVISTESLDNIPLYINDGDRFTKQLVQWRLKVGK